MDLWVCIRLQGFIQLLGLFCKSKSVEKNSWGRTNLVNQEPLIVNHSSLYQDLKGFPVSLAKSCKIQDAFCSHSTPKNKPPDFLFCLSSGTPFFGTFLTHNINSLFQKDLHLPGEMAGHEASSRLGGSLKTCCEHFPVSEIFGFMMDVWNFQL